MAEKKHGGARAGAGRPAFVPTQADRDKVWQLAGLMSQDDIARLVGEKGVSVDCLRDHFQHELAVGKARTDAICCNGLIRKMQSGDLGAICFYAKTRMGWREKSEMALTGPNGESLTDIRVHFVRALDGKPASALAPITEIDATGD